MKNLNSEPEVSDLGLASRHGLVSKFDKIESWTMEQIPPIFWRGVIDGSMFGTAAILALSNLDHYVNLSRLFSTKELLEMPVWAGVGVAGLSMVVRTLQQLRKKEMTPTNSIQDKVTEQKKLNRHAANRLLFWVVPSLAALIAGSRYRIPEIIASIPGSLGARTQPEWETTEGNAEAFELMWPIFTKHFHNNLTTVQLSEIRAWMYQKDMYWESGVRQFLTMADLMYAKEEGADEAYNIYLEQLFFPKLFEASNNVGLDVHTMCGLIQYNAWKSWNLESRQRDTDSEEKRLLYDPIFAYLDSITQDKQLLLPLAQFSAFELPSIYGGEGKLGALTAIRMANRPTLAWSDYEPELLGEGIIKHLEVGKYSVDNFFTRQHPDLIPLVFAMKHAMNEYVLAQSRSMEAISALIEKISRDWLHQTDSGRREYDGPMAMMLTDPNDPSWETIGMGIGLPIYKEDEKGEKKKVGFVKPSQHVDDVVQHLSRTSTVWKEYVGLEETTHDAEKIVVQAFTRARESIVAMAKEDGSLAALTYLVMTELEQPKFRDYLRENVFGYRTEITHLLACYEEQREAGTAERERMTPVYEYMAKHEYDTDFQINMQVGVMKYLADKVNNYPILNKLAEKEPKWRMFLALAIQELAPLRLTVAGSTGPRRTYDDLPYNMKDVLEQLQLYAQRIAKQLPDFSPLELLEAVREQLNGEWGYRIVDTFWESGMSEAEVDERYGEFIDRELTPLDELLSQNPYSGIKCAIYNYDAFTGPYKKLMGH